MVFAFRRSSSSRAISPASMVLPSPVSSAMNRLTPRQPQRLAERFHLVGVDANAGAERRLEEVRVGGRHAVPAQRVQERREPAGVVEALLREVAPALLLEDAAVDLVVPVDPQRLPLRVVVRAGQRHQRRAAGGLGRRDLLDQPAARAHLDQLADFRRPFGQGADLIGSGHEVREGSGNGHSAADILDEHHAGKGCSSDRSISVVKWRVIVAASSPAPRRGRRAPRPAGRERGS